MPQPALLLSDRDLLAECEVRTVRGSGPGGQKRSKTDSAVRLRHRPTGVRAIAEESRSQAENRRRALRRLREAVALRVREPVVLESYEPPAELLRAVDAAGRLRLNPRNPAYAVVVASVLDVLHACEGRLRDTADTLHLRPNPLTHFLAAHPRLWQEANRLRTHHGRRPLTPP